MSARLCLGSQRMAPVSAARQSGHGAKLLPVMATGWQAHRAGHSPAALGASQHLPHKQFRQVGECKDQERPRSSVLARSAAVPASSGDESKNEALMNTLLLGAMFGGWYLANIAFNIYNKQVLKAFPYPITITTIQFLVGSVVTLALWAVNAVKKPSLSAAQVTSILPLAAVHTLGNLLTNMSLGAVAVSFTHTIKAMEPFFSVILSAMFLGEQPSPLVLLTLLPIVGGVVVASLTEVSFNWMGFGAAMGSNLTFQSRNVLSKKMMNKKEASGAASIDEMALFGIITLLSALLLLPVGLLLEGWQMTPAGLAALGVKQPMDIMTKSLMAGLTFHLYQQVSYGILSRVSPVTHSIGNCVKRVVVIVASVFFFQNPMNAQNMFGTGIALLGVFAYSQVKRFQPKKPKTA